MSGNRGKTGVTQSIEKNEGTNPMAQNLFDSVLGPGQTGSSGKSIGFPQKGPQVQFPEIYKVVHNSL